MHALEIPTARSSSFPGGTWTHALRFRVRYSDTDQMGTFYGSRPLEWFECGRTELFRALGLEYAELERRGVFLPLIEAQVEYRGRARYDDLLEMATTLSFPGRARGRCDVTVVHVETRRPVVTGHTVHAFADATGRAIRPPGWFLERCRTLPGGDGPVKRQAEAAGPGACADSNLNFSSSSTPNPNPNIPNKP
jgi:acyl-CoA thioester hydrolase